MVDPAGFRRTYRRQVARAGGDWYAYVTVGGEPLLADRPDHVVHGYSLQKVAVAVAVLSEVDGGALALSDTVELTAADVLPGSGCYGLQPVWGDRLTVANVLTALLLVSDNTAVRLCGRLVPPARINEVLAAKGFTHTRVVPDGTHRMWLGVTTPRETHDLFARLAAGSLLSAANSRFVVTVLRAPGGYHDGIRRHLTSNRRALVATKYAADHDARGAARHEAGFAGRAVYAFFADGLGAVDDYAGTHPAALAHAALGRALFTFVA